MLMDSSESKFHAAEEGADMKTRLAVLFCLVVILGLIGCEGSSPTEPLVRRDDPGASPTPLRTPRPRPTPGCDPYTDICD